MGVPPPARVARGSHMRIAMQNTTLTTITLDNLDAVTGGTHDADGGSSNPNRPDAPQAQPQGTLGSRIGALISHLTPEQLKAITGGTRPAPDGGAPTEGMHHLDPCSPHGNPDPTPSPVWVLI